MFRMYFVPMLTVQGAHGTEHRPKYFRDGTLTPPPAIGLTDYGFEPTCAVGADLSPAQDAQVVAFADVNAVPFDLDSHPNAAGVTAVKNYLEANNIPAGWVTIALTWRQIVRNVLHFFSFAQAYGGEYSWQNPLQTPPSFFAGGRTVDTQFGTIPVAMQNAMIAAADNFTPKLDRTGLQPTTTFRTIFKSMADQMDPVKVYTFVGVQV